MSEFPIRRGNEFKSCCTRCGESADFKSLSGQPFCEWCFDKIDLSDKLEGAALHEAIFNLYGDAAFDTAHDAKEFREGR